MRTPRQRGWASTALALSAILILLGNSPLHAEEKITPKPSSSALGAALQMTRTRGAATVAVLTSSEQPSSVRFWNEFNEGAWARMNRGLVQVVNVSKDAEPGLVRTMGVIRFPTVIVYARGPRGVTQLGTIADCDTAEAMVDRLRSLDLGINPPAKADRAVSPTAFGGDIYPSQQVLTPPPVSAPPVTSAPPPQPTAVYLTPSVQATASVLQMPSQNLMIQQAPPQVFLAPTQAPVVYVPQVMSAVPAVSAAPAPAPTGNLFMTVPNVAAAPAPQPGVALAAAPTVAAGPPAVALAAAPTVAAGPPAAAVAVAAGLPALAAVSNSTLSIPSSGGRTRVRVRGPGLLGSAAARFGERLTLLGRARIETVQETTLEAPLPQSVGGGVTQISTTSTTPVSQGPTTTTLLVPGQQPPAVCKPPCPPSQPPTPYPTPQGSTRN